MHLTVELEACMVDFRNIFAMSVSANDQTSILQLCRPCFFFAFNYLVT